MDNQLDILIALYEEEKARLQKLIDECLLESEYLIAHYHLQALYILNGRLHTLNNIADKHYGKKNSRLKTIVFLEKVIESESSDVMREHYENELRLVKEDLDSLKQIPKLTAPSGNSFFFDEALVKLMDKKIKSMKLILNKTDNLLLSFSYSKKTLKVALPYVKQHTQKWILDEDKIESLKNFGFSLTENKSKLILTLTGDKGDLSKRLKVILAKIVFEIFYYKEFDNESYIQFTDKDNR